MNKAQCSCCQSYSGLMAGFLVFSTHSSDSPVSCSHVGADHIQPSQLTMTSSLVAAWRPSKGDSSQRGDETCGILIALSETPDLETKNNPKEMGQKGGGAYFTVDRKRRCTPTHVTHDSACVPLSLLAFGSGTHTSPHYL